MGHWGYLHKLQPEKKKKNIVEPVELLKHAKN